MLLHSTLLADAAPNLNAVTAAPTANPVPTTTTRAPPVADPVSGLTPVTVGGPKWNRPFAEIELVPLGVVTVTSAPPADAAGETARIEVPDCTVKLVAGVAPNLAQ